MKGQAVVINPWADFEEEAAPAKETPPVVQIDAVELNRRREQELEAERVASAEQCERHRLTEIERETIATALAARQKAEQESNETRKLGPQRVEPKATTAKRWPQQTLLEAVSTTIRRPVPLVSSIFDVEPSVDSVEVPPPPPPKSANGSVQKPVFKLGPAFESAEEPAD